MTHLKSPTTEIRVVILLLSIVLIAVGHWFTPMTSYWLHGAHLLLRKLYIFPVILGAIWFGLRGGLAVALMITMLFLPHIVLQWAGQIQENMNQISELITIWGAALITGWLIGKEKRALKTIAKIHEGTIIALVKSLDVREHNTQLHSLRVRHFSDCIARNLGLGQDFRIKLGQGALLHDIGKIGVPDEILLRNGPLTQSERALVMQHPELGYDILKSVPLLSGVSDIVLAHHEKFDGTGYPNGLKGDKIPLGARIFSLADAFDALISERPYQAAMPIPDAIKRLSNDSGTHFDPVVVSAFVSMTTEEWEHELARAEDDRRATIF